MEDENIKAATAMGTRRPRQGEVFWGEMVTTWKASGVGARRFCRELGLAVSWVFRSIVTDDSGRT